MYIDQTVKDVRYLFTNQSIEGLELTEYNKKSVSLNNIDFDVSILGESHKIEFSINGKKYNEIVACLTGLPEKSLPEAKKKFFNDFIYDFKSVVSELTTDNILLLPDLFNINGNQEVVYLDYEFESKNNFKAITAVLIQRIKTGYKIKTLHTYPNELSMLQTETLIEIL